MIEAFRDLYSDNLADAVKVIDYAHHEIHDGNRYIAIYSAIKNNAEFIELRFRPPDIPAQCHMDMIVESALASTVELWVATTKVHVVANAITPLNRNFNSNYI